MSTAFMGVAIAFALLVGACANNEPSNADVETLSSRTTEATAPNLATCNGRRECVEATVLGMVFTSGLEIETDVFTGTMTTYPAGELVMRVIRDEYVGYKIQTTPSANGGTNVRIQLSMMIDTGIQLSNDPGPTETCFKCRAFDEAIGVVFAFTIESNRVVESKVPLVREW